MRRAQGTWDTCLGHVSHVLELGGATRIYAHKKRWKDENVNHHNTSCARGDTNSVLYHLSESVLSNGMLMTPGFGGTIDVPLQKRRESKVPMKMLTITMGTVGEGTQMARRCPLDL